MTRAHDAAFIDAIKSIPGLSDRGPDDPPEKPKKSVFDGEVEGKPERWVNVHSNRGVPRPDRFAQPQGGRRRKSYFVQAVGPSKKTADAMADAIAKRLTGSRLELAGWTCERITHESSQPTQKDETVSPPIYIAVDTYDLITEPDPPDPIP